MTERSVYVALPLHVLDAIWPVAFMPEYKKHERTYWIEQLDRYVGMGLLVVSGSGKKDDPYRYDEVVEGTFDREWVATAEERAEGAELLFARLHEGQHE